jgi:hypothetical protein
MSSSFPNGISSMKLIVSTFEQEISSASLGNNIIQITNENIKNEFNNSPPGTIFNPSISVTYNDSAFPSVTQVVTPTVIPNYVPRIPLPTWAQRGFDIDGEAGTDYSGTSVSLSSDGTTLAIGANRNDGSGTNAGHVRVYKYDATKQTAQMVQMSANFGPVGWNRLGADIDGEAVDDSSGHSVSLSSDGTTLAIGSVSNSGNGTAAGHVRVYKYDATKLTAQMDQTSANFGPVGWNRLGADIDGEAVYDRSGYSVSLSSDGTTLAIGAIYNDGSGTNAGHVRVYKYDATKQTAQMVQTSPNFGPIGWNRLGADIDGEAAGDLSGYPVSLSSDGTTLAIGSIYNDASGNLLQDAGNVRVYEYNSPGNNWIQLGADIDGEAASDNSGLSVSLSSDGTTLAVGAPYNDGSGTNAGHVRVYKYDATKQTAQMVQTSANFGPVGWNRLGADIDGEAADDNSGRSVSLSADGSRVAIGAYGNDATGSYAGHVRVYEYNSSGNNWVQLGADIDGGSAYDNSGLSVSLSSDGTTLAVGAPYHDVNGIDDGRVCVYKYDLYPTLGTFSLPSDISVYMNETITRQLTPPTSNSNGSFVYASNNTAVATITNSDGVYSINVIGTGTTIITAMQLVSSVYGSKSVSSTLVVTLLYSTFGTFSLPADLIYSSTETITRQLTPPTSNSNGSFVYTSSNTDVATITNDAGVYSINVIGTGTSVITATQQASGIYASTSVYKLLNTISGETTNINRLFTEIPNNYFNGLDFNTGMTSLFTAQDDFYSSITMPNSNFKFNNVVYSQLYTSSNGWLSFVTTTVPVTTGGSNNQTPLRTFRFFSSDHVSSCSYKFDSNNTRLLINLTGYLYSASTKTFTVKLIISQDGFIEMNYTLASTFTADNIIIGYVGADSAVTTDDTFLTINGSVLNAATSLNLYNLLNAKTFIYSNV